MEEAEVLCAFTIENRRVEVGDPVEVLPRVRIAGEYTQEGFEYLVEPNGGEQQGETSEEASGRRPPFPQALCQDRQFGILRRCLLSLNPARRAGEREFPAPSRRRGNGAAPRRSRTWSPR